MTGSTLRPGTRAGVGAENPDRELGPQRFLQSEPAAAPRGSAAVFRAISAGFLLALVVLGVPAALLYLGAVPKLPGQWPDRQDLAQALNMAQILGLLGMVVWFAWVQFTVCVVVELSSAVRGVGLPRKVPFAGPSQGLARSLVGALLLTVAVAGPAATAQAATVPPAPRAAATVTTSVASSASEHGSILAKQSEAVSSAAIGPKVYTVKPPDGRYHDNLWDIAEKHLGDGRRYREIHDLNLGRDQADGRQLELSRLIQPGWQLVMPEDAQGVPRVPLTGTSAVGAIPAPPKSAPAPTEQPKAEQPSQAEITPVAPSSVAQSKSAPVAPEVAPPARPGAAAPTSAERPKLTLVEGLAEHHNLGLGLASSGLLAAGLLVSLRRRRRRPAQSSSPEVAEAEVALRIGADLNRRRALDLSLRELAGQCAAVGQDLPQIFAVRSADDQVELLLAPPVETAPVGWEVLADGSCWRGPLLGQIEAQSADLPTAGPFPTLVSIGRDAEGRDVLLELDAANGPLSLLGDPTKVTEIGTALALSLATAPWAGELRVAANGLSPQAAAVAPSQLHQLTGPEEITQAIDELLADLAVTDQVVTGAVANRGAKVLILAADPGPKAVAALTQLLSAPGHRARAVVVAAEIPGATWRLQVDAAGTVDIQPLGLQVSGYCLSTFELEALASLLHAARSAQEQPIAHIGGFTQPGVSIDDAQFLAAPGRLSILGAPEVRAEGPLDPARVPLATELVAFLATHRDGVHPTVLAGALWPRGVGAEVRDATIARVRQWLGRSASGVELLSQLPDGRLKLSPEIPSDWDAMQTLCERARSCAGQPAEGDLLRRTLRLVRGPLLAGAPPGRYAWVARTPLERQVHDLVIWVAHRLSEMQRQADPAAALAAANAGLRFAPREQELWRDLLLAANQIDAADQGNQLRTALNQMRSVLADLGDPIDAKTAAMIEDLLPGQWVESS